MTSLLHHTAKGCLFSTERLMLAAGDFFRNPRVAVWGRKHYKTGRSSKNMRLGDGIGLISETSTSKLDISSGLAKTQGLLVLVSGPRHGPGKSNVY